MIVLFDIDGTIADCTHRLHLIPDWDAFFAECPNDKPIQPIISLLWDLEDQGHTVIFCSGRSDQVRRETMLWLATHVGPYGGKELYMRQAGDHRPDDIVKKELLEQIIKDHGKPELVFDDRKRVVDMWRSLGLTCLQVADGDF